MDRNGRITIGRVEARGLRQTLFRNNFGVTTCRFVNSEYPVFAGRDCIAAMAVCVGRLEERRPCFRSRRSDELRDTGKLEDDMMETEDGFGGVRGLANRGELHLASAV